MHPKIYTNIDYGKLTDISNISNMKEDNKKLCKDLCKVGLCLSCFCSAYLILFLDVIDSELNVDVMNTTFLND
tara:strand:+ start:1293 stop:1511 length:219 start_codon:yes stop_codon:yes gene_type:complete